MPLVIEFLGPKRQPELLAYDPREKASHGMMLPPGRLHNSSNRASRCTQHCDHFGLLGIRPGLALMLRRGFSCPVTRCLAFGRLCNNRLGDPPLINSPGGATQPARSRRVKRCGSGGTVPLPWSLTAQEQRARIPMATRKTPAAGTFESARRRQIIQQVQAAIARELTARWTPARDLPQRIVDLVRELHRRLRERS
jgi:hypothetical protein